LSTMQCALWMTPPLLLLFTVAGGSVGACAGRGSCGGCCVV
jgi:hypothetical protein